MSGGWNTKITRRPLLVGLLSALGLGIAGGIAYELPRLMRRRYPPTPFDDLLSQLDDRDNAAKLGAAVIAEEPAFDAKAVAQALRMKIGKRPLDRAVDQDIVHGRLVEVQGWVLPETLALVSAIAAKCSGQAVASR